MMSRARCTISCVRCCGERGSAGELVVLVTCGSPHECAGAVTFPRSVQHQRGRGWQERNDNLFLVAAQQVRQIARCGVNCCGCGESERRARPVRGKLIRVPGNILGPLTARAARDDPLPRTDVGREHTPVLFVADGAARAERGPHPRPFPQKPLGEGRPQRRGGFGTQPRESARRRGLMTDRRDDGSAR
ncbi:hypothetical protein FHS01_004278 [Longimicrobium terrae]|uniref:Uncharacterized protein n=1 Tax=Longimicrobium terrae TaxID=1639882 RepID=A0A841H6P8_9BACT|nr:hypothetical protein [Longimicrobium terrae]MBB6073623.1 hypothetical protein [Longimicrobium terrae]